MNRIFVPTSGPDSWRSLLADGGKQWRTGYSAKAAAESWEGADGLPAEVAALLGDRPELLLALPEHKVPMPGPGYPSQCDVFALVRRAEGCLALAVEAKVDEPFGPMIGEWLSDGSDGKRRRLAGICEALGLAAPVGENLRYQLFHRTAAAVFEARRFRTGAAAMVVQSFSAEKRWFNDFAAFAACFGADAEPDRAIVLDLPDGMPLTLGWASGPPLDRG